MSHPLLSLREGAVARLRLNRPEIHNAFDATLIAALTGALDAIAGDPDIRVVVLEGEGASFSAGADLNWMRGMAAASPSICLRPPTSRWSSMIIVLPWCLTVKSITFGNCGPSLKNVAWPFRRAATRRLFCGR